MKTLEKNKEEILWNIINSLLAGGIAFLGSAADGDITMKGIIAALLIGGTVALTKFRAYWSKEKKEYCSKIFNFA